MNYIFQQSEVIFINKPATITNEQADIIYHRLPKQDKLLFALMRETGLRISDALMLKVKDITNPLEVFEHKTKKIRQFTLSEWLFEQLQEHAERGSPSNYAFRSPRTPRKPIHRSTYHRRLQRAIKGLKIACSAHSKRKLYARNIFDETKDIFAVQKALDHKYITTTTAYLDLDLVKVIADAASPPAPPPPPPTLWQKLKILIKKFFRR